MTPLLFALMLGCNNDFQVTKQASEMVVSPGLYDVGLIPVGYASEAIIRLDNIEGGDIEVQGIELRNVEGEFFSTDTVSLTIEEGGTEYITVNYLPTEIGYHYAEITIISDAKEPEVVVDVRAQAVDLDVEISPPILDFGPVESPDEKTLEVTITNRGEIDLEITDATFDSGLFTSPSSFPMELAVGETKLIDVTFTPTDANAAAGTLTLLGGAADLGAVTLQANDCENGVPEAYDVDGDGYTACAGDCDDDAPDARPGGFETWDDRDEDCDDIIDEGTEGYDDDGDGWTENDGDCNDGDGAVSPDQVEDLENGIDDDCDGVVDSGTTDNDGDGYSEEAGDCDDTDATAYPGSEEEPDTFDDDCDDIIDEGTTAYDDDEDGWTEDDGDCDDTDATIYPSAPELEDWTDNNCDGRVDEGTDHYDDDGDGFTEDGGDCDDADDTVSPAELETAGDGVDNDCDGVAL
jgi:hypothetical protein